MEVTIRKVVQKQLIAVILIIHVVMMDRVIKLRRRLMSSRSVLGVKLLGIAHEIVKRIIGSFIKVIAKSKYHIDNYCLYSSINYWIQGLVLITYDAVNKLLLGSLQSLNDYRLYPRVIRRNFE